MSLGRIGKLLEFLSGGGLMSASLYVASPSSINSRLEMGAWDNGGQIG
jgi:hypothetical protein